MILVVDDEPGVLRLCQRLLEQEGFSLVTVSSTAQALAVLARQPVDLMLADIRMPGSDGFHLLTLARAHQPDLAIVMMTGYGTIETAIEALHRGADGLILKPFSVTELIDGVQNALLESQRKRDAYRLKVLGPLFNISEALFLEIDPERLQKRILELVQEHLHCDMAGIFRWKNGDQHLDQQVLAGEISDGFAEQIKNELALTVGSNQPMWVNRSGIPAKSNLPEHHILAGLELESLLCAPIHYPHNERASRGNGVLFAARSLGKSAFQEADYEIFVILARQAAAALENASLYSDLHSYTMQLEKSQHALTQAEKLAAAGRLTVSIAHEINNPLQSLQNCLHLAGRSELTKEERQRYLDLTQGELERLMQVVQRMLDLYRPGVRDRQLVEIDELVKRVIQLIEPQFNKNRVFFETIESACGCQVLVVPNQIQQVLLNIFINAMESMPAGGHIWIWTKNKKEQAEILIEDEGPGIPEELQEQIFEPFVSTKENGTGLGLSVSYGIVTAHGGILELVKDRGKGASFRILLPTGE